MRKQLRKTSIYRSQRRRFSPLALLRIIVPAILIIVAGVSFTTAQVFSSHAAGAGHQHKQQQPEQQQQQPEQQQQQPGQQQQHYSSLQSHFSNRR